MNPAPNTVPSLLSLYERDLTIGGAMRACVGAVIVAMGIQWATLPTPPNEVPSFEAVMADYVALGGIGVSLVAAVILVLRYRRVKKILSQGVTLKRWVEKVNVTSRQTNSDSDTAFKASYSHSYYVTLRYHAQGMDRWVTRKLPRSNTTYNAFEGREIDLVVDLLSRRRSRRPATCPTSWTSLTPIRAHKTA